MAGCGEEPSDRPNKDNEPASWSEEMPVPTDQQEPDSLGDHGAVHLPILYRSPFIGNCFQQRKKRTIFSQAQLNGLEAFFKKKQYLSPPEREQLAKRLSLPQERIQTWFQNRRAKVKRQLNPKPPKQYWTRNLKPTKEQAVNPKSHTQDQAGNAKKATTKHEKDLLHKQKTEDTAKWVKAQRRLFLEIFPPTRPADSYSLLQVPHSSGMVYCQNVGGLPYWCHGTQVCNMHPVVTHKSSHSPKASVFNLYPPNRIIMPEISIRAPVPSVFTNLTSYDGPSTSSAPIQSQMPIFQDNADNGSSTITAPLIDETTDSDQENCCPKN